MASWRTYLGKLIPYQEMLPHKNLTAEFATFLVILNWSQGQSIQKAYEEAVMWSDSQNMNSVILSRLENSGE